jgi:putative acetyltransferase
MEKLIIRPETKSDQVAVEALTREAFWNLYVPGCDEHYLVHIMREHPDYVQELAFVAELDGEVIGSIHYTNSRLHHDSGEIRNTMTFGPLCVHPRYQRRGVGTRLLGHTLELVRQKGFTHIITYGDPHNYFKHGFRNGRDHGISDMKGEFPLGLLVLELEAGRLGEGIWKFQESDVYNVDKSKIDAYDTRFPAREKKFQYSQALFSVMCRAYVRENGP